MAGRKEEFFLAGLAESGVTCQPGVEAQVAHFVDMGFVQAIASSAPRPNIDFVNRLPFASAFECIISAEEIQHGKPAPDIFLAAARGLDVNAKDSVVLEDAPAGVAAGKAAGAKVIAIAAAFDRELLTRADLVVASFEKVLWSGDKWKAFILHK